MKTTYLKPILKANEVVLECGFAVSSPNWVEGGPGGDFDVNDYDNEL